MCVNENAISFFALQYVQASSVFSRAAPYQFVQECCLCAKGAQDRQLQEAGHTGMADSWVSGLVCVEKEVI